MFKWIKKIIMLLVVLMCFGCAGQKMQRDVHVTNPTYDGVILINGNLGESDFVEFYNQTRDESIRHYRIIINTSGGSATSTVGILERITELKANGIKFTTETYTKAYSAGAFIWMMGDERIMHPGSSLMWHTMLGQFAFDEKEWPPPVGTNIYPYRVTFEGMDEYVYNMTKRSFPNVDPMTLETMLLWSGMTFLMDDTARELGMLD